MRKFVHILLFGCALLFAACFIVLFFRLTAFVAALLSMTALVFAPLTRRRGFVFYALAVFFVLGLLPFDVSLISRPGPPRIVRLVYGLPSKQGLELAKRGEIVLGGCIVSGYPATWILVW